MKGMDTRRVVNVFGASSCWGAQDRDCDGGPQALYARGLVQQLEQKDYEVRLHHMAALPHSSDDTHHLKLIAKYCCSLATDIARSVDAQEKFVVVGGDHSCAIGTWSGAANALSPRGPIGLIWVDAHMDSHTPFTSGSGAVHGMPLAALLGKGDPLLTQIGQQQSKLLPENVCLVGVRSFEEEEQRLLDRLGVRVYSQQDVDRRGLDDVMREARALVRQSTVAYGVSIDLDAMDPKDAPGVGSPEPGGLSGKALAAELACYRHDDDLLGIEIVELNPVRDTFGKTSALAMDLLLAVL